MLELLRANNNTCLPQQGSLDAMDLGDLEGQDPESLRASLRQANGDPAPASANSAGNMAGMPRAYKDSELRRLEEEVRLTVSLRTSFDLLRTHITRTLQGCLQSSFRRWTWVDTALGGHAGATVAHQTHSCKLQ